MEHRDQIIKALEDKIATLNASASEKANNLQALHSNLLKLGSQKDKLEHSNTLLETQLVTITLEKQALEDAKRQEIWDLKTKIANSESKYVLLESEQASIKKTNDSLTIDLENAKARSDFLWKKGHEIKELCISKESRIKGKVFSCIWSEFKSY